MPDRVIALTDVVGYSSPIRTYRDRTHIREALHRILTTRFGSDHDVWYEGRGDGMLIVFPEDTEFWTICQSFEVSVAHGICRYNAIVNAGAKLSLRVALDYGDVAMDSMGYNGDCMIRAGRLIQSELFKRAMSAARGIVGIIAPTELVQEADDAFNNVRTQVKGMSINASMRFV